MLALLLVGAHASETAAAPAESRVYEAEIVTPDVPVPKSFKAIVQVQTRGAFTNLVSSNPLLDGQVVGTIGGTNGIIVDPGALSAYTEQRAGGFFSWKPDILDGKAGFNAAFEVDFAWGDRAYGTAGNVGGGYGGDTVNVQTRRLTADLWQSVGKKKQHHLHVVAGLQFLADSSSDPSATTPDGLFRSGGGLMFFGSEAAGLSLFGAYRDDVGTRFRYRLGTYTLVELGLGNPDDAWLSMADATWIPSGPVEVGLHAWWLRDHTGGQGGALGSGPSSPLSQMLGGPRVTPYGDDERPAENAGIDTDVYYFSLDAGYNAKLTQGPFGIRALGLLNTGKITARGVRDVGLVGTLFDVEARLRWAQGKGSIVRAEVLYSTPDDGDASNQHFGVVTGNSYGFAGAIPNTHGTLLLFSDPRSINRLVAVVPDVSGGGLGVLGVTGSAGYDVVPDRLTATVGGGAALAPQRGTLGTEINAELEFEPFPFFKTYVTGAYVLPGDQAMFTDPAFAGYVGLDWLAF